jgi:quercetin dioxygenase-like cupin family protein
MVGLVSLVRMADFPDFVKNPLNRIATESQFTEGIEGYVFDGADGSQVAFWRCNEDRESRLHTHDFDEYTLVIEGRCVIHANGKRIELCAGQEIVIPRGTPQTMEVQAGTRTMHVFGGKRARRTSEVR